MSNAGTSLGLDRGPAKLSQKLDAERFFALSIDMFCVAGTDGFFRQLNPAFERTLGFTQAEMLARPFVDFIHADDVQATLNEVARLAEGEETIDFENRYLCKDGEYKWLSWRASADADGQIFAVARDETERHRIEEMKREFISTVSHELRTPLTSVSGALGLIDSGAMGALPPKVAELVTIASKNSRRLLNLINDLLDIERVAAGKMPFDLRPQPLQPLLELAVESNRAYADTYGVKLLLSAAAMDSWVSVDADRLLQVLANLMSNAAKFSAAGSVVRIAAHPREQVVRIEVSDHGRGIPEAFRARIFQKFSQAQGAELTVRGGSGLGLAIAKELVERMGGSIGFESVLGLGSTFHIELPLCAAKPIEADSNEADAQWATRPRILVVEDDADAARLLQLLLRQGGYRSEFVLNGAEGLRRLREDHFDAVTLDLMLPDMNGADFLRRMRAWPASAETAVVVVSGIVEQGRLALGGEFPALDWLPKPIDQRRLLQVLAKALQRRPDAAQRILHVDDDADLRAVIASQGAHLAPFDGAGFLNEARQKLQDAGYAVVLLDLMLPDGSGWDLLPELRACQPTPEIVIFSATEVVADDVQGVAATLVKSRCNEQRLLTTLAEALQGRN